jgi:hypothetical protein
MTSFSSKKTAPGTGPRPATAESHQRAGRHQRGPVPTAAASAGWQRTSQRTNFLRGASRGKR